MAGGELSTTAFPGPDISTAAVRSVESLFEAGAVVGVVLYVIGFVTGEVDLAVGVALGVAGAVGNLALGFGRVAVLES